MTASTPSDASGTGPPGPTGGWSDFRTTLVASASSGLGDGLVAAAFPLLIASQTDSALLISGVLAAQRLPWLVFALHGGALVDRLPMRRFLPAVDLVRFVVVGLLAGGVAAGLPVVVPLYVAAVVVGTGDTIMASGLEAAVPALVPDDRLDRANGTMFISQATTEHLAGPALGGVLFGVSAALPLGLDALTFLVSATLLARCLPQRPAAAPGRSVSGEVGEAVRWFFRQADLREMTIIIGSFGFMQAAVLSVLVILVEEAMGGGATTYGVVLAGAAVGNLLGAAVTGRVSARFRTHHILLLGGTATGAAYAALGLTRSPVVATALLAVEGIAVGLSNIAARSYRQRRIPRAMLGRGSAPTRLVAYGVIPVGALAAGAMASALDIRTVFVALGLAQIAVAVVFAPRLGTAMPAGAGVPGVDASAGSGPQGGSGDDGPLRP